MRDKTHNIIFSSIVMVLFAASLHIFYISADEYWLMQQKNHSVEKAYQDLLAQQNKLEKLKTYSIEANRINNVLVNLGYTENNWTQYRVDLDKGVRYAELNQLLSQANHGDDYFFIPENLHIRLADKSNTSELIQFDAHLTLNGYYLVKKS